MCYPWGIDPDQGIATLHQPIIGQLPGPKVKRAGIQSAAFNTLLSKRLLGLEKITNYEGSALLGRALWDPYLRLSGCGRAQCRISAPSRTTAG